MQRVKMNDNELNKIFEIYNEAKNKILLYVRSSIQNDDQFKAIRKLILDEMGRSGAEGKIKELAKDRYGQAGNE